MVVIVLLSAIVLAIIASITIENCSKNKNHAEVAFWNGVTYGVTIGRMNVGDLGKIGTAIAKKDVQVFKKTVDLLSTAP